MPFRQMVGLRLTAIAPPAGGLLLVVLADAAAAMTLLMNQSTINNFGVLLAWSVLGCAFGSWVKVALLPPANATPQRDARQMAVEFSCAFSIGISLTPMMMLYWNIPLNEAFAIGISFCVSLFVSGMVHKLSPLVERWGVSWFMKTMVDKIGVEMDEALHDVDATVSVKSKDEIITATVSGPEAKMAKRVLEETPAVSKARKRVDSEIIVGRDKSGGNP